MIKEKRQEREENTGIIRSIFNIFSVNTDLSISLGLAGRANHVF